MRKKSKLPDNLYHFTSLVKYRIILESGKACPDSFQSEI